jgi:hypothetical protein
MKLNLIKMILTLPKSMKKDLEHEAKKLGIPTTQLIRKILQIYINEFLK